MINRHLGGTNARPNPQGGKVVGWAGRNTSVPASEYGLGGFFILVGQGEVAPQSLPLSMGWGVRYYYKPGRVKSQ